METPESAGGGGESQESGEQGSVDLSGIASRLDQMGEQFNERFSGIEQHVGIGGEPEFQDPYEETQEDQGQEFFDPYQQQQAPQEPQYGEQQQQYQQDPQQQQEAQLQALREFVRQEAQSLVEPLQTQQSETERYIGLSALEDTYPDLQDPEIARETLQRSLEIGKAIGVDRAHATHPDFVEQVYLAGRNLQGAEGETPAGVSDQDEVVLEGGGGASRAQPEPNLAEAIVNSGNRRLPFMGGGRS